MYILLDHVAATNVGVEVGFDVVLNLHVDVVADVDVDVGFDVDVDDYEDVGVDVGGCKPSCGSAC